MDYGGTADGVTPVQVRDSAGGTDKDKRKAPRNKERAEKNNVAHFVRRLARVSPLPLSTHARHTRAWTHARMHARAHARTHTARLRLRLLVRALHATAR